MTASIEEATKRAGVVWVHADERVQPMWHIWYEGSAWVVTGAGEQPDPGLGTAARVTVQVGSYLRWDAEAGRVEPGSDEWARVVPLLLAGRLNLPDRETAAERWARFGAVYRLVPQSRSSP